MAGIDARVELALIIKALSYGSRLQARDVEDIYRLLEIADTHPHGEIGGWRLHAVPLSGSRGDAARHLHALARQTRRTRRLGDAAIPAARLAALIAALIGRPD